MSNVPADLKYSKDHEWVRDNGDGTATIGISDHAQESLGDLVYVEVPEAGRKLAANEPCAVVESVKAASDVYSPLTGTVTEINTVLGDAPETINEDPYGDGWIFKVSMTDRGELDALLDAATYEDFLDEEET